MRGLPPPASTTRRIAPAGILGASTPEDPPVPAPGGRRAASSLPPPPRPLLRQLPRLDRAQVVGEGGLGELVRLALGGLQLQPVEPHLLLPLARGLHVRRCRCDQPR